MIPDFIVTMLSDVQYKNLSSCTINGRNAVEVDICEKGNKAVIVRLLDAGWKRSFRRKVRTDKGYIRYHTHNQYSGYAFVVRMQYFY
jgi:hypothetical protein